MKILLISLSNVGDVVLTTPVASVLAQEFPHAELQLLVGPKAAPLFEDGTFFERVWRYDKRAPLGEKVRLMAALCRERFDLAVDLRHSLIPWLIGARRHTPLWRRKSGGPRREQHLAVLKSLGLSLSVPPRPFPFTTAALRKEVRARLQTAGLGPHELVVLAPGAASDLKRWPLARWQILAERLLAAEDRFFLVAAGDAGEHPLGEALASLDRTRAANWCGLTSLRELAALVSLARLVVTHDSAILHLAAEQNIPVVSIFGPTDPRKYGPRHVASRVVRRDLACSPCEKARCPYHHECLDELSADAVWEACRDLAALPPRMAEEEVATWP